MTTSIKLITDNNNLIINSSKIDIYQNQVKTISLAVNSRQIQDFIKVHRKESIKYIERYQDLLNNLIPIHNFQPKKLMIPSIRKIEIEKTDTIEIKQMIRKLNIKTQSFTCDHRKSDKKYDMFEADLGKIYLLPEKKDIDTFNTDFSKMLIELQREDNLDKTTYLMSEEYSMTDINKINDKIIAVNNRIIELESHFKSISCHKCDHIIKLYEITLETINEMRDEVMEELELSKLLQEESNEVIGEDKYSISTFMKKHYPTMDRIPLMDIINKYKEVFGIKKTQKDMKDMLEIYNYKISNVAKKFYVNRA